MPPSPPTYVTLEDWIAREAIPFSPASPGPAIDRMIAALGDSVDLLALGEPLHGADDLLELRNAIFRHLVAHHGYTAIAIESSFPRGHLVNEYVLGCGGDSCDSIQESGFSHGFGAAKPNRAVVEWLRQYNAAPPDAANPVKLHFWGFDSPTEMTGTDSPRPLLRFALDYLASLNPAASEPRRKRIEQLLGSDADWENPAAMMDPSKSIGLSPAASALRIETEEFIIELQVRGPELAAKSGDDRYRTALQHALLARQMLTYHAGLAGTSPTRIAGLLGLRDLMMAHNLASILEVETRRGGKVLAYAHSSHVKRNQSTWQLGPHALAWWPAGAHLTHALADRYAVIGCAVGTSEAHGIGAPEPGTLEAHLAKSPGPTWLTPTYNGRALPPAQIAALSTRSGSTKNSTYLGMLSPQSFADFDWLLALDSIK